MAGPKRLQVSLWKFVFWLTYANKTCGSPASAPICYPLILFPFLPTTVLICCLTLGVCTKLGNKGLASRMQGIKDRQKKNSNMHGAGLSKCILPTWSCQICTPFDYSLQQLLILSAGPLSLTKTEQQAPSLFGLIICHVATEDANNHSHSFKKKQHTKIIPLSLPGLI